MVYICENSDSHMRCAHILWRQGSRKFQGVFTLWDMDVHGISLYSIQHCSPDFLTVGPSSSLTFVVFTCTKGRFNLTHQGWKPVGCPHLDWKSYQVLHAASCWELFGGTGESWVPDRDSRCEGCSGVDTWTQHTQPTGGADPVWLPIHHSPYFPAADKANCFRLSVLDSLNRKNTNKFQM